jgi:methionyl-tRNA formyltransferase
MKITILTDNPKSWILPYVEILKSKLVNHSVDHVYSSTEVKEGDLLLILSCEKILSSNTLKLNKKNIVVHPSKLPQGKGWSPLAWQILEGRNTIPISLFEASENLDSGDVYILDYIELKGHELNDEIKHLQGLKTIELIDRFIINYATIKGVPQLGEETFYPRRRMNDNVLDLNKNLKDQFNLLRVVDNERYPANFNFNGFKYIIKIYKSNENEL